jgi:uncharacterized protein (TIGR03067 family)/prepilin-type processing-associated H-X9-DG protein
MLDFISVDPHGKRGTYALMADGSVRFLPENIDPAIFKAMVTRAGGESVGDINKTLPKLPVPKGLEAELKGAGSVAKKDDPKKIDSAELLKLQGRWKVNYLFRDGKSVPPVQLDALGMIVEIEGSRMTLQAKDKPHEARLIALLDPKASPKKIVVREEGGKEETRAAVYILENDGDKLRIRIGTTATAFPKDVVSPTAGDKDMYIELTKEE